MTKELHVWLILNDLSLRRISKRLGVSNTLISDALSGKRPGVRIRQRLIAEIGIPPALIEGRPPQSRVRMIFDSTIRLARGLAVHRREGEWRVAVRGDELPQGFPSPEEAIEYAREARCAL